MAAGDNISDLDVPVLNDTDYVTKFQTSFNAVDAHDHSSGKGVQIPSGGIADGAIETAKIKDGAVTNDKLAGSIDLAAKVTGVLPAANGGTGFNGGSAANGEIAIGNGSGFSKATLTGTSNQITITNGSGSITISGPQDLAISSSPTFAGATFSGLSASQFVKTDGSKALISQNKISLTGDVEGDLPVAEGGTGASTATAGFDNLAPTTSKGDLIIHNGTNNIRLPAGTNGYILSANSGVAAGAEWIENTGGSGGGFVDPGLAITGDYAADADDNGRIIPVATSNGSITVTLPFPSAGLMVGVKDADGQAGTNFIEVAPNSGEDIDDGNGASDYVTTAFGARAYISDGTNWYRWADFFSAGSVGGIAVFGGGNTGSASNVMDTCQIAVLANCTDFGDLSVANSGPSGTGNSTRGVFAGGNTGSETNEIAYINPLSASNTTDFGDLTVARDALGAAANDTRALFAGGEVGSTRQNVIDTVLLASTSNATDYGDSSSTRRYSGGCSSTTRAVWGGGNDGSSPYVNNIDFNVFASSANANDFGDLTVARETWDACSSATRGFWGGGFTGSSSNVIDTVVLSTEANATDWGDLLSARDYHAAASSKSRGLFAGGATTSDQVQHIELSSGNNATDFGNLTVARSNAGGISNAHGGIA